MEKNLFKTGLIISMLMIAMFSAKAQSINYTIRNDVQTSERTLEFDLYLLNTNTQIPINLCALQSGLLVNEEIENGWCSKKYDNLDMSVVDVKKG